MAGSLNMVQLIGNLGRDPEIRTTQAGEKIANLAVATSESWADRTTGERKERTEWSRVVIFNERLVDVAEKYARKGSKLYIQGQLQTRKFTGNDGVERYQTEVVLSKFRGELTLLDTRSSGEREETPRTEPKPQQAPRGKVPTDDISDEIPF